MRVGAGVRPAGLRWDPHMLPVPADYPWRWSQAVPMNSALIKWLYLPDFLRAPDSTGLISECPHLGPAGPTGGHGGSARAGLELSPAFASQAHGV